jgi:hypothetical protein
MSRPGICATLLVAIGLLPTGQALGQPAHDDCAAATVVTALPFSDEIDTTGATVEVSDPPQSCALDQPNTHSVWYRLESAVASTAIVDLSGTDYFAILSVYDGTCGALTETLCSSGIEPTDSPYALVPVPAGVPVYLEITSFGDPGGTLRVTVTEPAAGTPVRVGPEFRVNDFDEYYQGAYLERGHGVCMAASGAFVVVWEGDTYEGSHDIFARRFDADGVPQTGDVQVSTSTAGDQALPNVACGTSGDFVVVWSGPRDTGYYGINLRRFDATGTPTGGELEVATVDDFGPNYGRPAEVSMDGAGGFVVTWSDDGTGDYDEILAQRYDPGGSPLGAPLVVSTPEPDEQYYPDVAVAPGGDFVVVWEAGPDSDAGKRILGRRYDDAGVPLGVPFAVSVEDTSLGMYTAKVDDTHDGATIETVVMPIPGRVTLCVSSQAGCALGSTSRTSCSWAWASAAEPRGGAGGDSRADRPEGTRHRPVFFEYTLVDGVNDTADAAARLPALLAGIPCRLNVIPMNPYPEAVHRGSPPEAIARFAAAVHAGGIRVTVRRDRGTDIAAACGQLATTGSRPSTHS